MSITFPTNDITASSTVAVQFGYRYNITSASLSNCQYATGTAAYQTGTCSVQQFGSGVSISYIITYTSIYPTTALSQSALKLKVVSLICSLISRILGEEAREQHKIYLSISMIQGILSWELDNQPYSSGPPLWTLAPMAAPASSLALTPARPWALLQLCLWLLAAVFRSLFLFGSTHSPMQQGHIHAMESL